ncbi:hypothetical protein [Bradyrhizobium sp. CCBAU 51765]|uniref:hypothetical protein n=1 Tax=Bradyrhizobium sp. CCBAU 51765 TaxID=1325102 RepID=UPI0018875FD1|nr:hypothetical protein [Bradyrhizobium sp. CCBAU 51765]QOZ06674.1 hypothetical protein XH96_03425 [Bradyrhizobium sp. CCBAU 51765]
MPKKMHPDRDHYTDIARQRGEAVLQSNLLLSEITPPRLTSRVEAFCRSIGSQGPVFLKREVVNDPDPACSPVERRIAEVGGSSLRGWAVKCVPGLWASAEARTVWVSPTGETMDLGLDAPHEDQTLLIPDTGVSQSTEGRSYRINERLLVEQNELSASNAMIAALPVADRIRYEMFARCNGVTVAQVMRTAMNIGGPIATIIDRYLKEKGALDAMLEISPNGQLRPDPRHQDEYANREIAAEKVRAKIISWAGAQLRTRLTGKLYARPAP